MNRLLCTLQFNLVVNEVSDYFNGELLKEDNDVKDIRWSRDHLRSTILYSLFF